MGNILTKREKDVFELLVLNKSTKEIGNTLGGKILLNKMGITKEVGNFSPASETQRNTEAIATKDSPKLFYIDEMYPIIKVYYVSPEEASAGESSGWVIDGVNKEEYDLLSIEEKASVEKTYISQVNDPTQITESTILSLIQKGYPSYSVLKGGN